MVARAFSQRRRTSVSSRVRSTWAQGGRGQRLLPGMHQGRLAGGRGGLFLRQGQRALGQAQAAAAQRHGAGGDDQHLLAPARSRATSAAKSASQVGVRRAVGPDQQGRADLDDQPARRVELAHGAQPRARRLGGASPLRWRTRA
jgi:hypothetical protein